MMQHIDETYMPYHVRAEQAARIAAGQGYVSGYLPESFRFQSFMLFEDVVGGPRSTYGPSGGPLATEQATSAVWDMMLGNVLRLFGRGRLSDGLRLEYGEWDDSPKAQLEQFIRFDERGSYEHQLSCIEICWRTLANWSGRIFAYRPGEDVSDLIDRSIGLFNNYAAQSSLECRFDRSTMRIIEVGSDALFREAIEPAFELLQQRGFKSAQTELSRAFRFLRSDDHDSAIQAAYKSFENTVKHICSQGGWVRNADTKHTSELLKTILPKLFPPGVGAYVDAVHEPLKRLSTIRDAEAAHGQGTRSRNTGRHVVSYMINSCAASIVVLIRANDEYTNE